MSPCERAGGERHAPARGDTHPRIRVVDGRGAGAPMVAAPMGQRTGPGTRRGWTPSPVRAARRVAQMNAARRARAAERVAIFWDLVEERGLTLEQLTTRVRRDLVSQAKEIQHWADELARAESTPATVPEAATVVTASIPAGVVPVQAGAGRGRGARALRSRPGRGMGGNHVPP
jgi:hypothetical protein